MARGLRRAMTLPEVLLWRELRQRPGGFKFRHQHGAGPYVLDFYCVEAGLAIEVDGRAHDSASAAARDALRSRYLRARGVATTRIAATLVLSEMEAVVQRIVQICHERVFREPLHHPAGGPPPLSGEDFRAQHNPPPRGEGDRAKRGGGAAPL